MTDWRVLGDIPKSVYAAEFARLDSPMLAEVHAVYAAAQGHSALALAMMFVEQKYATLTSIGAEYRNPLSLRGTGGAWARFGTWAAGVSSWKTRITSATYKGGAYAKTVTLADLIHTYAPDADGNNEARYVALVEERIAAYRRMAEETTPMVYPTYPVLVDAATGRTIQVESPVPIVQKILPASKTNQRPGIPLRSPWGWVQHETANTAAGADAEMHHRYLMGLTTEQVSFHFVVDDHQTIQLVPIDEVTWQAADGSGPGNMASVSCELCVNRDGNEALARRNAEWLCGGVLKAFDGTTADVKRHWDFNAADPNRHHCPDHMMNEGYWPTFVANVGKVIAGGSTVPTPSPGITYPSGLDKGLATRMFGSVKGEDGRDYHFDEGGAVSQLWLSQYGIFGWPEIKAVWSYDGGKRRYLRFASGPMIVVGADGKPRMLVASEAA